MGTRTSLRRWSWSRRVAAFALLAGAITLGSRVDAPSAEAQVPGALNALLTASPMVVDVGQPVTFFYRASPPAVAPPFPSVSLAIQFGDGTATGPIAGLSGQTLQGAVAHSYARLGTYTATLIATSSNGQSGVAVATVQVTQACSPPVVSVAASPSTTPTGQPVTFTYSAVAGAGCTQLTAPLPTLSINFGDGSTPQQLSGPNGATSHTYSSPGSFSATVIATSGSQAGQATATVQVTQPCGPPVVTLSASPSTANPGQTVAFTYSAVAGAGCTMATAPLPTLTINYGDGTPAQTLSELSGSTSRSYAAAGAYTATLTATSGPQSGQASASVTVVQQTPPTPPVQPIPAAPSAQPTIVALIRPAGVAGESLGSAPNCTRSDVLTRPGVWRCNTIDPCFAVADSNTYVICNVEIPSGVGQRLNLAQPLDPSMGWQEVQPSARQLELVNGAICTYVGGATFGYEGQRANYQCNDGMWIVGQPQPGLVWTVTVGTPVTTPMPSLDPATVRTVNVLVAWV